MYDLALLIVGLLALASAALPTLLRERLVTFPVLVIVGGLVLPFAFPDVSFDPVANGFVAEHLTEFAVIIALTGLGLSIDRPVSWQGWMTAWRLLAITMPLSIVAAAFVGWWVVGLAPAAGPCSARPWHRLTRSWPWTCRPARLTRGHRKPTRTTRCGLDSPRSPP